MCWTIELELTYIYIYICDSCLFDCQDIQLRCELAQVEHPSISLSNRSSFLEKRYEQTSTDAEICDLRIVENSRLVQYIHLSLT